MHTTGHCDNGESRKRTLRSSHSVPILHSVNDVLSCDVQMTELPLILAIGDGLIAGYGLQVADSFPAQLQAGLQPT